MLSISSQCLRKDSQSCTSGSRQGALGVQHKTFVCCPRLGRKRWPDLSGSSLQSYPCPALSTKHHHPQRSCGDGRCFSSRPPERFKPSSRGRNIEGTTLLLENPPKFSWTASVMTQRVPRRTHTLQGPVGCTNTPFAFASLWTLLKPPVL